MTKSKKTILKRLKRKNRDDTIWHPESRLIFKSQKEKIVVGRLAADDFETIVDEIVIELCNKWKFKIDPLLVESESEENEEDEEEDAEEEAEEDAEEEAETKPKPAEKPIASSKSNDDEEVKTLTNQINDKFSDLVQKLNAAQEEIKIVSKKYEDECQTRRAVETKLEKIKQHFFE